MVTTVALATLERLESLPQVYTWVAAVCDQEEGHVEQSSSLLTDDMDDVDVAGSQYTAIDCSHRRSGHLAHGRAGEKASERVDGDVLDPGPNNVGIM